MKIDGLVEYFILGSKNVYETSTKIVVKTPNNVKKNVLNIIMFISPLGKDWAIICDVPSTLQYDSITIPPLNNPIYDGINKAARGLKYFLRHI